ncbi:MAG: hypothetical protein ACON5H_11555 [Akkermansiaceae bacterium]
MFWWILANILAITFAIGSWVVCLNLFRDPAHPTSYKLMLKFGRLAPLEAYDATNAPRPQKTSGPLALEAQFQKFKGDDLAALNHELLTAYLTNYKKAKFLTYVQGDFRIIESRALTEADFLPRGVAVKAQALVTPKEKSDPIPYPVFVECLYPSENADPASFPAGETLKIVQRSRKKTPQCAAVVQVNSFEYDGDSALYLTLIPLCAVDYETPGGEVIKITPPEGAGVGAPFPVFQ